MSNSVYQMSHTQTVQSMTNASNDLNASNWINLGSSITGDVGAILTITGFGTPFGLALSGISAVASVGSAGTAGIALYDDFTRLVQIHNDLSNAINVAYNPVFSTDIPNTIKLAHNRIFTTSYNVLSVKKAYGKMKNLAALESTILIVTNDYNGALTNFLTQVNAGNRSAARSALLPIIALDSVLNSQTRFSSYAMYAGYSVADSTVSNFDSLYSSTNDSISISYSSRQATYLNILAYLMDSTKTSYIDSMNHYGQVAIVSHNQMASSINQTLNVLQPIGVPGYIAPTVNQPQISVDAGSGFNVKVNFKNFGGTIANGIYAKLFLTSGFIATIDSIPVGDIAADASGSISFSVIAPNVDTTGSYSVLFVSSNASSSPASGVLRSINATGVGEILPSVPKNFALHQNYPNPFNPTTTIEYSIPSSSHVTFKVYDMLGRKLKTLVDGQQTSGVHEVRFDASNLASGIYIYRLQAGSFTAARKLIVVK